MHLIKKWDSELKKKVRFEKHYDYSKNHFSTLLTFLMILYTLISLSNI